MNAVVTDNGQGAAGAGKAPPPAAEVVEFADGRKVEFAGKKKMLKESEIPEYDVAVLASVPMPSVRFDFRNGETRTFVIPAGLLLRFATHGAEQKIGDETAGETDLDDMVLAVDALIERLNTGEWNARREGGGMSGTSVLLKAMVEVTGKPLEAIKAFLKDRTQAEKIALRNAPKFKVVVQRMEEEKAAKASKVDTDSLLAGAGLA